ncbi:MAG: hypothetical protein ACOYBY_15675 [Dermatophilaceae bacterium]
MVESTADRSGRLARVSRHLGWATLSVLVAGAALAVTGRLVPDANGCIVRIELAGSVPTMTTVLADCGLVTRVERVRESVLWDFAFIVGYAVALALVCAVGSRAVAARRGRVVLEVAAFLALVAAAFDVVENVSLLVGLPTPSHPMTEAGSDAWLLAAQGAAIGKFVALVLPVACAGWVAAVVLWRAGGWLLRGGGPVQPDRRVTAPDLARPAVGAPCWRTSYTVPAAQSLTTSGGTGVCLSGGGIRAGVFAMGALQSLAGRDVLTRTRLLATVSGGGYFGSALQTLRFLALAGDGTPLPVDQAFAPGSAEEDYVRRHGRYIADGTGQWVMALFVVLRNALLAVALAYAVIVPLAWAAAQGYVSAGATWAAQLFPIGPNASPTYPAGIWVAVTAAAAGALVVWVLSAVVPMRSRQTAEQIAAVFAGLVVAILLACAGVPAFTAWVVSVTNVDTSGTATTGTGAGGPTVGVLAAVAAAVTTVWNGVAKVSGGSDTSKPSASLASRVLGAAAFATRFLLTVAVVGALVFLAAVAFAAELHTDVYQAAAGAPRTARVVAAAVVLVGLFLTFDQTRMSLHPFYKRRLASAFSIRRTPTGVQESDWDTLTWLSSYGEPLDSSGMPSDRGMRLLLCAAAHAQGPDLAPPGRRVVPFVFSADAVGSPRLGYLGTSDLEEATRHTSYQSDFTLLAAAALSGAAFASSMGRASGPFDTLLAVSNARLGAWLPNPRYHLRRQLLDDAAAKGDDGQDPAPDPGAPDGWTDPLPGLERHRKAFPRLRRLGHYVREIAGVYPVDDRFVYVTDGGHYENLGLVELLRRGCTEIFCVDASGDHSLAHTLAEAAALAYEELGVVITIEGMALTTLSAADGQEGNLDLRDLHKRLARQAVVKGSFTYPAGCGPAGRHTLVVGKAVLGTDLLPEPQMWPLLAYASVQSEFPSDSTADQWFDVDRYQGYLVLGRLVGERMSTA